MKSIINITKVSFLFGLLFTISGCDNEPEVSGISRITYFPEFVYEGPSSYVIPCSSDFQVPPVTATEGGNPLPIVTSVLGLLGPVPAVDITKPDYYVETTSAVNQDGFAGEVVRTFWVACTGDLVNSLEGLYTSTITRTSSAVTYTDKQYILIRKVGDNTYELSNADGGWYELGRNLGPCYRSAGATVTAVNIATNTFTFGPPVEVGGFGGPIVLTSMTVDAAAKKIVFTSDWAAPGTNYTFTATLTQVAL
ncbi:MAG TPA: hypothetical protein VGK46_12865 [Saprospiraceae bacterium]